jgi:hypothetical protein
MLAGLSSLRWFRFSAAIEANTSTAGEAAMTRKKE